MIKYLNLVYLLLLFLISSCHADRLNEGEEISLVDYTVQVKFKNGKKASRTILELKNLSTGDVIKSITDSDGKVTFQSILPGSYELNASNHLSKIEYQNIFGEISTSDFVDFNAILQSINIRATHQDDLLVLTEGIYSPILIKQIYYAGSDPVRGASIRDQFIELYNNSNEVQYADNLCIAQIEGSRTTKIGAFTQANGQYDWSLGQGQENNIGNKANTDFVYAITIFRIKGSGKEHLIAPGKSIVIAATALNHKKPFKDLDGEEQSVISPELTVDLSEADYEAYLGDYQKFNGEEPYFLDIQNPSVPDLGIDYFQYGRDMLFEPYGNQSFVLFRATQEQVNHWKKVSTPGNPNEGTYVRIPKTFVLDGVDLTLENLSSTIPKKLPLDIDGGQISVSLGVYSSQSIIRKTKEIVEGRVFLQDTNNSRHDFVSQKAEPRTFQK